MLLTGVTNPRSDLEAMLYPIPLWNAKNQAVHPIPLADSGKLTVYPMAQTDPEKQPNSSR
ncbi:MAG TPA: hypothetical protein VGE83_09985 [Terracidiphilus sp.]